MITDSVLLQANATIIAGILIFLAIAPYAAADIIRLERRRRISILYTLLGILAAFIVSIAFIFFRGNMEDSLFYAEIAFFIGLLGIGVSIAFFIHSLGYDIAESGRGRTEPKKS